MARMTPCDKRLLFYTHRVLAQRAWIESCGGDLSGYVTRYGMVGDPRCTGDGGEAIYRADRKALWKYEQELADLKAGRG